jgi:hypothetical protein
LEDVKNIATGEDNKHTNKEWELLVALSEKKYNDKKKTKYSKYTHNHCEDGCSCGHKH